VPGRFNDAIRSGRIHHIEAIDNCFTKMHSSVCRFNDAIRSGRIHHIEAIDNCCILAAVGQQMASRKGVSATMFSALAKSNINIRYGFKA